MSTEDKAKKGTPAAVKNPVAPPLRQADGYGKRVSDCGDEVEFFIGLKKGRIEKIEFQVNACANIMACTKAAAELAKGKTLSQARKQAAPQRISELLGGLSKEHEHAAELVFEALAEALTNAARSAAEPWKKLYRTRP